MQEARKEKLSKFHLNSSKKKKNKSGNKGKEQINITKEKEHNYR